MLDAALHCKTLNRVVQESFGQDNGGIDGECEGLYVSAQQRLFDLMPIFSLLLFFFRRNIRLLNSLSVPLIAPSIASSRILPRLTCQNGRIILGERADSQCQPSTIASQISKCRHSEMMQGINLE